MSRFKTYLLMIGAVGFVSLCATNSFAQRGNPINPGRNILRDATINRPTVSPYLNLVNNNNSGISNYHTLVRPQIEQRRLNRTAQTQFGTVNRQLQSIQSQQRQVNQANVGLRPTGHRTYFQNHSHFYSSGRR